MPLTQMNLHALRSTEGALEVMRLLRYDASPLPFPGAEYGLHDDAVYLRSHSRQDQGYGVVIGTADQAGRSLRKFGRRLIDGFHDQPLAVIGLPDHGEGWRNAVVVRPRLIEGGGGAVSVAKLTLDPAAPTMHDVEVINGLEWALADAPANQKRIDEALDVERVTSRFYKGLAEHHEHLLAAVKALADRDPGVAVGIEAASGPERVALRIVTQILFCYFLQRKGLLEGQPRWIRAQFEQFVSSGRTGFYRAVLEPLFYEAFAKPLPERPEPWRERDQIPFLNGGLFERTYVTTLDLPDHVFSTDRGLLGFLDSWTFTVAEEAADEHEVAVDPEMLGKVFENLVSDEEIRREGTVYTPRPVVQFMCREALVPYLEREAGVDEATARLLLTGDEPLEAIDLPDPAALARRVDDAIARCTVLDPAVGSGAFPLGMLTEFIRLRRLAHQAIARREPTPGDLWKWKLHAVERSLFGVDINPGAVELCRLRLWLALLVEEEAHRVHPLPNLDYRVICADSLTDFLGGFEVQQTRDGPLTFGLGMPDTHRIVELRERYFEESRPAAKAELRTQLADAEDTVVERIFAEALDNARLQQQERRAETRRLGQSATVGVAELRAAYGSRDRRFPLFVPAFHAPEIVAPDGWSVVIMNPPYVGRKEVAQRLEAHQVNDLQLHYGRTYDLMIHFAFRALELARPGGVVSMIFNDSIFTSEDADPLRRRLLGGEDVSLRTVARSRCFEGKAVNGGVIVAVAANEARDAVRWVENHGRPTTDLAGASVAAGVSDDPVPIGESELWVFDRAAYAVLPHRPLFRPSRPARDLLGTYERCAAWRDFGRYQAPVGLSRQPDWPLLSDTRALNEWKRNAAVVGFYDKLRPGMDFVLLGLVVEGGQGLATADDRRFIGAIDGTPEAAKARQNARQYLDLVRARADPTSVLDAALGSGSDIEGALLTVAERFRAQDLGWPRIGLVRVVDPARVRHERLSEREVDKGLAGDAPWVPYEKGDDSDDGGGARWTRKNPLVIDWSLDAVSLLRRRARQADSYRKPRLQNENYWGKGGVTWNRVASYLRVRLVPEGGIFSSEAPTIRATVPWLTLNGLLALLNAPVLDFAVRTFLGSRMHIELGDLRCLPVPVLADAQGQALDELGTRAIAAKLARDAGEPSDLGVIEREIDEYVRDLYGIARDAELWVVR